MNEEEVEKNVKTKFNSPLPFVLRFRNLIFGVETPDIYTQITFFLNLALWTTFMLWSIISYVSITAREYIYEQKKIPVEEILFKRGSELGLDPEVFLSRLQTMNGMAIICWIVFFIGLVLLYRKKKQFIYFVLTGSLFYIGMQLFYIKYQFFKEDTTNYDKIALLIILVSTMLHAFLMRNERMGGSISFFGEPPVEEES